jgi:BolA protein
MSRHQRIQSLLQEHFQPWILEVLDQSHQHQVPKDAQTHYQVLLVSTLFEQKKQIDRHRSVQQVLQPEFAKGLHALTLALYTPEEWKQRKGKVATPPPCKQGFEL